MRPESKKYLWDALNAATGVAGFVANCSFEEYLADFKTRSAVERQLQIIGEALAQLRSKDPEAAAQIPELPRVVAFRNILVHGYADVDQKIVWGVIVTALQRLQDRLREMLGDDDVTNR